MLADEMGMGKSLAVLALVIRTLDRAREWAAGHRHDEHPHSTAHAYSHSTLVVVPSARKSNSSPFKYSSSLTHLASTHQ